jgi:hypothetical protein
VIINKRLLHDTGWYWGCIFEGVGLDTMGIDIIDLNLVHKDKEQTRSNTTGIDTFAIPKGVSGPFRRDNKRDETLIIMEDGLSEPTWYVKPPKCKLNEIMLDRTVRVNNIREDDRDATLVGFCVLQRFH